MDVEVGIDAVGRLHYRRRRRHNRKLCTFSDPINMSVTVHDDRPPSQRLEPPNKPISTYQRCSDSFRQRLCRLRIFDNMMVKRDDPIGTRVLRDGNFDPSYLFH
jgi:hypothetical protein